MNMKTFGKFVTKHGLWGKPLEEMSVQEIAKLEGAFAVAQIETEKHCGKCHYQGWEKLQLVCTHPDHPGNIYSCTLDKICPDWSHYEDKELGTHKLNRKN